MTTTASSITDEFWGNYFKQDLHGVQGGAAPVVVGNEFTVDPYPTASVEPAFADMWCASLSHCMKRFEGKRATYKNIRSGGVGCFTVDSFPVFDYMRPNVYVIADSEPRLQDDRRRPRGRQGRHRRPLEPALPLPLRAVCHGRPAPGLEQPVSLVVAHLRVLASPGWNPPPWGGKAPIRRTMTRAVSVSPLSSSSPALDLLTGGSTASAALAGQGDAAAADPNFEDALFQQSSDPSLSQAAYADPGLAAELSALQAISDPSVTGDPFTGGSSIRCWAVPAIRLLSASATVPGQVNQDVLSAYQMAGTLSPNISGDDQPDSSTSFDAFA